MPNQPLSVLHFTNAPIRGGAEEHILTLLRGLDRKYFHFHLVCPAECAEELRPDLPADVELLPLCLGKPRHIGAALRLAQILRKRKVDILHSHQFYASLFASPIGWLCRVPVVMETPHLREAWRHGPLKGGFAVDRLIGRFVDHYIAVSQANARYLVELKGLPKEKIIVIHNGCDLARFTPGRPAPPDLRGRLRFDKGDPVLLVVGRLEPQKGHHTLLETLPAIRREFPRVRLVCLGEGSLRPDLEREASALGLEESVRFVGYQPNVADWLALADVAVLPSLFEGLPLVAIESLAAGKPMVATAVDGTPEVIVNEKTGLTVPPGDSTLLAEAICRLLREPALRQNLGRSGRQWVEERFGREEQVRRTQELYLRAWAESRRRRFIRPAVPATVGSGAAPSYSPEERVGP
ncbi:MAG: glycosyltransferase family 4 protein [Terriglobia bacterium]|jgi:glycosyltransferase involved in cell wall biosynthesis